MTDHNLLIEDKKTGRTQFSAGIQQKIDAALIKHVYQQGYIGQATSIFCATVLFFGLYNSHADNTWVVSWYALSWLVTLYRSFFISLYLRTPAPEQHILFWKRLFIFHAFLGGTVWGIVGGILFPPFSETQQLLVILLVAGVAAGSTPVLSAIRASSFAFLVPTLLPLMLQLLFVHHEGTYSAISVTIVVYFLYLLAISFKINQMILNAIHLQFENELLVTNLSKAKGDLEDSNKQLTEAASHDPLTGVANRKLFSEYFNLALKRAEINKEIVMVMFIDLDNFKFVNDAYGHHVGDQLLIKFIKLMEKSLPKLGFIGRLGGDELAVIVENVIDLDHVNRIASALCKATDQYVMVNKYKIHISASIGVSIYPTDGTTAETLLKLADRAMYYIKEHGRNNFHLAAKLPEDDESTKRSNPGSHYIL